MMSREESTQSQSQSQLQPYNPFGSFSIGENGQSFLFPPSPTRVATSNVNAFGSFTVSSLSDASQPSTNSIASSQSSHVRSTSSNIVSQSTNSRAANIPQRPPFRPRRNHRLTRLFDAIDSAVNETFRVTSQHIPPGIPDDQTVLNSLKEIFKNTLKYWFFCLSEAFPRHVS